MYPVSNRYLNALDSPVQRRRVRGTINGRSFTEDNILKGSLKLDNKCMNSSELKLGAVFVGQLQMTILGDFEFPRGLWKNATINLDIGLEVATDVFEWVPCGTYYVSKADHTAVGVVLTAYDAMNLLDKECSVNVLSGFPFDVLREICKAAGAETSMTRAQVEAMPNGDEMIGTYSPNNFSNYRDILSALAQVLGGFATADRAGKIVIRRLSMNPVARIEPDQRLKGGKWSDFSIRYTGLSVVNMSDSTTSYYNTTPDNGSVMNLGSNPFLQLGLESTVNKMRRNILREINTYEYVPFTVEMLGDIAYDLGDMINFSDGIADGARCCMMAYSYTYNKSFKMSGFGEDPKLVGIKSKTDKDISGISSTAKQQMEQYYIYTNSSEITFGSEAKVLGSVNFVASVDTYVEIWHEFKVNTSFTDELVVTIKYYLDGELVPYSPVETFNVDGYHTINTHYIVGADAGKIHQWTATVTFEGGTGSVQMNDARIVLHGQGLVSDNDWDGLVEVEDAFSLASKGHMTYSFGEDVSSDLQTPIGDSVSDTFSLTNKGHMLLGLEDHLGVILREGIYPVVSEDGVRITSEDSETIITEGGQR